jgi:hypothetical protein
MNYLVDRLTTNGTSKRLTIELQTWPSVSLLVKLDGVKFVVGTGKWTWSDKAQSDIYVIGHKIALSDAAEIAACEQAIVAETSSQKQAKIDKELAMWVDARAAQKITVRRGEYNYYPEFYLEFEGGGAVQVYPKYDFDRKCDREYMSGGWYDLTGAEALAWLDAPQSPRPEPVLDQPAGEPEGLTELEAAHNAYSKADAAYERAYEREEIATPASVMEIDRLTKQYPRAAAYRNHDRTATLAADDRKATAARQAADLILKGGRIEDAQAIADDWMGTNHRCTETRAVLGGNNPMPTDAAILGGQQ